VRSWNERGTGEEEKEGRKKNNIQGCFFNYLINTITQQHSTQFQHRQ
jgi:hypothetical protein